MATRMQQRRGTAAQWISTNDGDGPILEVGEIGFETDTGKFKIGDGVNNWIDLDYFLDESEIDGITGDYILSSTLGQNNGVATLDGSGNVPVSQLGNIIDAAPGALDTLNELAAALNDDASFATTITNSLALKAPLESPTFTGTVILPNSTVTNDMLAGSISNDKLSNSSITINGSAVSLGGSATIDALPSQTGNGGKYLTTDGTNASWDTITTDATPSVFMLMGA